MHQILRQRFQMAVALFTTVTPARRRRRRRHHHHHRLLHLFFTHPSQTDKLTRVDLRVHHGEHQSFLILHAHHAREKTRRPFVVVLAHDDVHDTFFSIVVFVLVLVLPTFKGTKVFFLCFWCFFGGGGGRRSQPGKPPEHGRHGIVHRRVQMFARRGVFPVVRVFVLFVSPRPQ